MSTLSAITRLVSKVDETLKPAVMAGVRKGQGAAKETVESWGSKDRRSKDSRSLLRCRCSVALFLATFRGMPTANAEG